MGLTWKATATDEVTSLRRGLATDPKYDGTGGGLLASLYALLTGGETNWKQGDDHDINDLGAYVYEVKIDGKF